MRERFLTRCRRTPADAGIQLLLGAFTWFLPNETVNIALQDVSGAEAPNSPGAPGALADKAAARKKAQAAAGSSSADTEAPPAQDVLR